MQKNHLYFDQNIAPIDNITSNNKESRNEKGEIHIKNQ